jgi:hypothetical protein
VRYTALVAEDDGGGTVIVPGPVNSEFADQVFNSTVMIGRAKRDIGLSYISLLATDRENHDGGGYNRLGGPDFPWRPSESDNIKGQWLWSSTKTPNRPDLTPSWTGETLTSHAAQLEWNHNTEHLDWFTFYKRLFTARVSRVRGVYAFTPRSFVRAIVQYVSTERDPALYLEPVDHESAFMASSILFAYKLNWQSVLLVGYGDDRELSELSRLEKSGRQAFVKVSYPFQR